MKNYEKILSGGDIRSIGKSNYVVNSVSDRLSFDRLFKCLESKDRVVVMRALDAIEKITKIKPNYLTKHKVKFLKYLSAADDKEFKWHLALIIPRIKLNDKEFINVRNILTGWAFDKTSSRIVRVNSVQGLFELNLKKDFTKDFFKIISVLEKENIPSLNARIRILKNSIQANKIH